MVPYGLRKFLDNMGVLIEIYREKSFDVESDRLDARYKDWQKKLHPDLVHTKSEVRRYFMVTFFTCYLVSSNRILRAKV